MSNRRMDKAETEAIRNVLAGNRDAYRVLMDRYFCTVTRIAFRITGNEADAEEAAQEAFLRAYNKLSELPAGLRLLHLGHTNRYEHCHQPRRTSES